ncbi:MAG: leucine--tRNA ligase [Saprospiraceae bacterium]|nr:leucine--tRNA ligase [Saprospiraceae bacterium]
MEYQPSNIEPKWRKIWNDKKVYKVSNDSIKPKYYVLDMFPYPSGAGLHVGHPLGYIASDIFSRYKRHKGFNVLHPMGYDAFGLPAEQYAIDTGIHPAVSTKENINRYRDQLENLGFSYDWDREVATSDPNYYKWTQWIFLLLYEHYFDIQSNKAKSIKSLIEHFELHGNKSIHAANTCEIVFDDEQWKKFSYKEKDDILMGYRLAYRKESYVNWCEALGTVLANDEVKDGVSERGGFPVEKKPMLQWSLRITAYAERLLKELEHLEWSEALIAMQRNWIGRSEGATVHFGLKGFTKKLEIFTTRPDTIFGVTFMVLAPEHELVNMLTSDDQKESIESYLKYVNSRSDVERMAEVKEVTGCFTGSFAVHPFTGKDIPIYIGEYVLKDYGTGAIMAVPSDDERDMAFAEKFNIEIIDVVDKSNYPGAMLSDKLGVIINSDFLNGKQVPDAIKSAIKALENKGIGKLKVNYKLRDANYSRQRYWGEPFPIVYDKEGASHALPLSDLPVTLPDLDDFKPSTGGKSPLAKVHAWVDLPDGYVRETDTMPGFAGSSWYYLRYMDATNDQQFASPEALNYWQNVDLYIGGTEHAVGHLMYSRFWHKVLFDLGYVPTDEPFKKLINQGMIQGIIESLFVKKAKTDGLTHIVSSEMVTKENEHLYAKIPVHIEFVTDYGSSNSYLNKRGVELFIRWRSDYQNAIFESPNAIFQNGQFIKGNESDFKIVTNSEVGKMSKSKYNVINPDDVVSQYGADCFRMYEMFLGPVEQAKPWDTKGIDGVSKFLRKYWSLFFDKLGNFTIDNTEPNRDELKILHAAIKKVNDDIERFSFNTCISSFMVCVNELKRIGCNKRKILEQLTILLSPFAPHVAAEIWEKMGNSSELMDAAYPIHSEEYLIEDTAEYPICINGKKRAEATFDLNASQADIEKVVLDMENVTKWFEGKPIKKFIIVKGKMINIVL